jgi:hypothetical protein
MLTKDIKKILTNREVEDQPFPEVVPHTHNGVDSPALGANTVDSVNISQALSEITSLMTFLLPSKNWRMQQ